MNFLIKSIHMSFLIRGLDGNSRKKPSDKGKDQIPTTDAKADQQHVKRRVITQRKKV